MTTVVGGIYLVGAVVYWAVDGDGILDMPHVADLVGTMPEWGKILRLGAIGGTLPYGPVAISALGVIDLVCNILPATFALGYNWATLPPPEQQLALA